MTEHSPNRFQFRLRSILIFIFIFIFLVGVISATWSTDFVLGAVPLYSPVLALIVFFLVRRFARSTSDSSRLASVRGWLAALAAIVPLAMSLFVWHRWVHGSWEDEWPREFPYPDVYLNQLHNWWDRLHPTEPGTIKIHGEFYTILLWINVAVLIAWLLIGSVWGYVFRNGDFLAAARRLTKHCRRGPSGTPSE